MLGRAGLITLAADTFTRQRQDRALPMLALEVSFMSKHRSPGGLGEDEASWHKKQESGKEKEKAIVFSYVYVYLTVHFTSSVSSQ